MYEILNSPKPLTFKKTLPTKALPVSIVAKRKCACELRPHELYLTEEEICPCVFPPEMRVWAGLGKAASQMVKVSLAEHAVFEEGQLPEEHLRHLSQ